MNSAGEKPISQNIHNKSIIVTIQHFSTIPLSLALITTTAEQLTDIKNTAEIPRNVNSKIHPSGMKNITHANACMNIHDRELLYVYLYSMHYMEYFKILLANMKYDFYNYIREI